MANPDRIMLGWALRVQNRVGSGKVGLKGIKGSAQNQPNFGVRSGRTFRFKIKSEFGRKRDIEFRIFKVAVKNWSNDQSQCLLE